jgi:hypothetical protein
MIVRVFYGSVPGQSQPGRADSRSGHVGFPPIATDFCGAAKYRDVHTSGHALHSAPPYELWEKLSVSWIDVCERLLELKKIILVFQ